MKKVTKKTAYNIKEASNQKLTPTARKHYAENAQAAMKMGVLNYTQSGRAAAITPSNTVNVPSVSGGENTQGCILYTGSGGTIKVMTIGGDIVTFFSVPAGQVLQVRVLRVYAEVTTASNLVALW